MPFPFAIPWYAICTEAVDALWLSSVILAHAAGIIEAVRALEEEGSWCERTKGRAKEFAGRVRAGGRRLLLILLLPLLLLLILLLL